MIAIKTKQLLLFFSIPFYFAGLSACEPNAEVELSSRLMDDFHEAGFVFSAAEELPSDKLRYIKLLIPQLFGEKKLSYTFIQSYDDDQLKFEQQIWCAPSNDSQKQSCEFRVDDTSLKKIRFKLIYSINTADDYDYDYEYAYVISFEGNGFGNYSWQIDKRKEI